MQTWQALVQCHAGLIPLRLNSKVISVAEQKGKHHAAKLFGVHGKRVQDWCKSKEHLKSTKKTEKRKPGAGRPVKYTDIENTLLTWFNERRSAGKALKYEALRLHKINGNQSFKASQGWFSKFKKCHGFTFRRTTHVSQHAAAITDDKVGKCLRFVIKLRKLRGYEHTKYWNMNY